MSDRQAKNKGGRPSVLSPGEKWVMKSFNLTPEEARIYEMLREGRSNREFALALLRLEKRERIKQKAS